ncbi:MAG: glycosyltransferase [candidate division SR1 bacterium]|nr:glycosyltransferase [candidate division SR1 bacterium]
MITIIIPAYNEQDRIQNTLDEYGKYYQNHYLNNYEIIVVLNGCKDETEAVIIESIKKYKNIKYLNFPAAIGKGGAIKEGLKIAKGELVGYTDADNSTRPEILHRLFSALELTPSLDCIIGSREVIGSVIKNKTLKRKIMSRAFNGLVNFYFNTGFKDTQCGAKVVRSSIIPKIMPNLLLSDMSFDVNFIVDVQKAGGKILEMPIEWEDDNNSTVKPVKTSLLMFMSITRLKILYSPLKVIYPYIKPASKWIYNKIVGKKNISIMENS